MGDKSPEAIHRQAAQKKLKANAEKQQNQQALTAKPRAIKMRQASEVRRMGNPGNAKGRCTGDSIRWRDA